MPPGTQIDTNHLFSFPESGWFFALVEAPAPSPGEQFLFWVTQKISAATRLKIADFDRVGGYPLVE